MMTVLTFCIFSAINIFSKWFYTLEVLDLPLVVVLVGSCVSGATVSYSAGCVLFYFCVSKKRAKDCMCIGDVEIKS